MMRKLALALLFLALMAPAASLPISAAEEAAKNAQPAVTDNGPVTLPKDIIWETDNDEPLIGSDKAIRGGTLNVAIPAYPLTFRLMGPNNNDFFASWNRQFTTAFSLVGQHPVTDK